LKWARKYKQRGENIMKKRIISMFMAAVMVFTIFPTVVFSQSLMPTNVRWEGNFRAQFTLPGIESATYRIRLFRNNEIVSPILSGGYWDGSINWGSSGFQGVDLGRFINESGSYHFDVQIFLGGINWTTRVASPPRTYIKPAEELGVATNLRWEQAATGVRAVWNPPANVTAADSYFVELYRIDEFGIRQGGFAAYANNSNYYLFDGSLGISNGNRYYFSVRALSGRLDTIANGKESALSPFHDEGIVEFPTPHPFAPLSLEHSIIAGVEEGSMGVVVGDFIYFNDYDSVSDSWGLYRVRTDNALPRRHLYDGYASDAVVYTHWIYFHDGSATGWDEFPVYRIRADGSLQTGQEVFTAFPFPVIDESGENNPTTHYNLFEIHEYWFYYYKIIGSGSSLDDDIALYRCLLDGSREERVPDTTYTVNVNNGTGSGNFAQGATVNITAGTPPSGQQFKNWTTTSAGVTFANADSASTTFVMPANAVTVTANFEPISGTPTVATPTATPANRTFSSSVNVTLATATDGAAIYYTLDGSTPSTASSLFTAPIPLTQTTTIKAIAVKDGVSSDVLEVTFTRSSGGSGGGGGGGGGAGAPPPPATPPVVNTILLGTSTMLPNFQIPRAAINAIAGTLAVAQLRITTAGNQDVNLGAASAGQNALLIRLNAASGELEVVSAAIIGAQGNAVINVTAAGDFIVMARKTGDITGTGTVETSDALALLRHVAGVAELNSVQLYVANGKQGDVGTNDALNILRYVAGITGRI
jgi:hypothetical protein